MYKHLTSEERHYIAVGIKQGMSKNKIAQHLNRSHSTIIREISLNTGKQGYRYNQADGFAQQRHQTKNKFVKLTVECKRLIANCLTLDWSPEQVCGWLSNNNIVQLHHESVYRHLLKDKANGGLLYKRLRH